MERVDRLTRPEKKKTIRRREGGGRIQRVLCGAMRSPSRPGDLVRIEVARVHRLSPFFALSVGLLLSFGKGESPFTLLCTGTVPSLGSGLLLAS
jgi:hypothetical protein